MLSKFLNRIVFRNNVIISLSCLCLSFRASALEVGVDRYDSTKNYAVIKDTMDIVFFPRCSRDRLEQFEWKLWEGNFEVKATIQPIADITITRGTSEYFSMDTASFTLKAVETSAKIGGNILCFVDLKKNRRNFGIENLTFRAYKQFFLSGHPALQKLYEDKVAAGLPMNVRQGKRFSDARE